MGLWRLAAARRARAQATAQPPQNRPVEAYTTPEVELEKFGPVARQNHIAYVPAQTLAGVPGVGTANLAYVPDFLLSAPEFMGGNAQLRKPNAVMIAQKPVVIVRPKTTLEGLGGVIAGQVVHQPLLAMDFDDSTQLGMTTGGSDD